MTSADRFSVVLRHLKNASTALTDAALSMASAVVDAQGAMLEGEIRPNLTRLLNEIEIVRASAVTLRRAVHKEQCTQATDATPCNHTA